MVEKYVILDAKDGSFMNLVLWDGNTSTWQPPEGTVAKLASDFDFNSLTHNSDNE